MSVSRAPGCAHGYTVFNGRHPNGQECEQHPANVLARKAQQDTEIHVTATSKAMEHLLAAEKLLAEPEDDRSFARDDKLADHVLLAEGWSRLALAVKP